MPMLGAGAQLDLESTITCSHPDGPTTWITYHPYTPLKNVSSLKDYVSDRTEQDAMYFDFYRIFYKQRKILNEWVEEYVFLRDEAYDVFSRNPNEYNAIRLRQISNYLDGFLEAHRLFEMISSELGHIRNNGLGKIEVNLFRKASQLGTTEIDIQALDELLQRVDSIEQERVRLCSPLYSGTFAFDSSEQYSVSGSVGTFDNGTMARITVG